MDSENNPIGFWIYVCITTCFFLLCIFWPLFGLFREDPSPTHPRRWGRLLGSGLLALALLPFAIHFWADVGGSNDPNARIPLGLAWSPGLFLIVLGYFFHNLAMTYATEPSPYWDYKYEQSFVSRWCVRYVAMCYVSGVGFLLLFLGAWLTAPHQERPEPTPTVFDAAIQR